MITKDPMSNSPKRKKVECEDDQTSIIGPRMLTHDAYTVGWICVLRSELNASRALLDEEHERLPLGEKDDNSYLLGRMGKHNVVIVFPGSGTYGTNAAAKTANNMVRTFRNIRFGLMVGVGGGAPRPPHPKDPLRDIRLGDVVVSDPKGNHGKHPAQVQVFHDIDSFL
jgi:nucleoside phosphorylase